jgi:hypothetical protein
MDNADRGANAANDELVRTLRNRARAIQALADPPHPQLPEFPGLPHRPIPRSQIEGFTPPMTAEKSHRFVLTGHGPEGRNRTILWQEAELVKDKVVRRVVLHAGRHDDYRDSAHVPRSR